VILIFEGVDCVGKTTLINEIIKRQKEIITCDDDNFVLLERLRSPYVLPQNRTKETDMFSISTELTYLKALHNKMNLILDRFHFSHYIYALTRRGYDLNDFINNIDYELSKLHIWLFFIDAANIIINDRLKKENDQESLKNLSKEHDLMLEMFMKTNIKHKSYMINNNEINLNDNIERVCNII